MIVDPDFLEHWRTRMLVDALGGDEFAPFYLIRLWGHCQTRKATKFEIPAAGVKGLCKATCDAATLEKALTECGYLLRDGACIEVLKWAEQNASLLAAWENGNKGGRPAKAEPNQNPRVPDAEPKENPAVTQGKPNANPDVTDKTRLDEIGELPPTVVVDSSEDEPPKAGTGKVPCPHKALLAVFHEECPTMPTVIKLSSNRKTLLASRWRDVDEDSRFSSVEDGLTIFRAIFKRAHTSDFLSGRSGKFKPGFDWLMQQGNFLKLCEGNYDNRSLK